MKAPGDAPREIWTPRPLEPGERRMAGAAALAAGVAVGAVAYYVSRMLLARDRISVRPEEEGRRE